MSLLFSALGLSFITSLTTTPLVIWFFKKNNWLEDPNQENRPNVTHTKPIPRGGGISCFLAIFVTSLILLSPDPHLKAILIAAMLTLIVGLFDDLHNLSPYLRLITNALAAIIIIQAGIKINFVTNPFGGIINLDFYWGPINVASLASLIWILWLMNVVGWSAGIAGQLPGFIAITSLIIGLLSLRFIQDITQWPVTVLAGGVAGAYLGFLPFNFHPQKIMPGYSGKSLAGLFIAVLAILSGAKLATVILTLGLPMIDGIWAIIRRLSKGKMPIWGDAQHLHHLLLKAGVPQPLISVIYWIFSAGLGAIVLQLNSRQKIWAFLMVGVIFIFLILMLKKIIRKNQSDFSA